MSHIVNYIHVFNPPVPTSINRSPISGTSWQDIGIPCPKPALTQAAKPTETHGMVLDRPFVSEPRKDQFPAVSGIPITPLIMGLGILLLMRRQRC